MTNADWIKDVPVAHRGYHDLNRLVWENTLSAFSRAVEAGFAIECDLHYASDGVPIIFHDEDLQRLCNLNGDIRERTSRELGLIAVGGTVLEQRLGSGSRAVVLGGTGGWSARGSVPRGTSRPYHRGI